MKPIIDRITRAAEFLAALMMAAMFLTFILQITVRYTARAEWIAEALPFLDPSHFGWTLEFCLLLWVWIIFFGNAFIVRERDHVTFDILYTSVPPGVRRVFAVIIGVAIAGGLLWSIDPTWGKFWILRLKKTATLSHLLGDWVRVLHLYSVYLIFLVFVAIRYGWRAYSAARYGAEEDLHHYEEMVEDVKKAGDR